MPHAVVSATPTGLVDAEGVERKIDVLVVSTGFEAQRILAPLDIVGRGGVRLHDAWADRATAFLGTTVPGFPNFFILYGPNTNGGTSIIAQLEREAEIAVAAIRRLERGARTVDTTPAATRDYVEWIDAELASATSAKNSAATPTSPTTAATSSPNGRGSTSCSGGSRGPGGAGASATASPAG